MTNLGRATYLADTDIMALADSGHPVVDPFLPTDVKPASVDMHLNGEQFEYRFDNYRVGDTISDADTVRRNFDELVVPPQHTVHVGLTARIIIPDDCLGWVFARSSLTRLGLRIAPVFMNPGYSGYLPLTITNAASFSVTLVKGVRVAQLVCARLENTPSKLYAQAAGKYMHENASPSRIHTDDDIKAALRAVLSGYFPENVVSAVV